MLAALLSVVLSQATLSRGIILPEPAGTPRRLMMSVADDRLNPPKLSPKQKWMFEWLTEGYVQLDPDSPMESRRIRVYSQEHKMFDDRAPMVARMALRLWEYNYYRLHLDHAMKYDHQVVDFYLCYGGQAGGEQLFGGDAGPDGKPYSVNTIYIYDLSSFASPLEMAREIAHEYGHATLPPIGGYKEPEFWANGYLGEKIFLRYIRNAIAAHKLDSDDAMGVDLASLNAWVKTNVDEPEAEAAAKDPAKALAGDSHLAMRTFLGFVLWMQDVLPPDVFARSLQLIGSTNATDYPAAVVEALDERPGSVLGIPTKFRRQEIWLPIRDAKPAGVAVLKRDGDWALVSTGLSTLPATSGKLGSLLEP